MLSVVGLFIFPHFAKVGMRARLRVRAYTRVLYHTRAQKCAHNTRVNTSHARYRAHDLAIFLGLHFSPLREKSRKL